MSDNTATVEFKSSPSSSSYAQHTSIWFADGNVVLLCVAALEGTENMAFRIHRSILSHHSKVFKDMFSVGGGTEEEMMDGCPVVRIYDKADDVANLFRRLYSMEPRDVKISPSLQLISSLMGLASKYIMDSLRRELVDELLQIFPTSLSQYRSSPTPDNPILGIDIGVKYEIPAIIPAACYRGALLGSQQIIDGFRLPDGTSTVSTVSRALCTRLRERLVLWIQGDAYDDDDHRRPSYLPTHSRDCSSEMPLSSPGCCGGIYVSCNTGKVGGDLESRYCDLEFDIFSSDENDFRLYEDTSYDEHCTLCLCFLRSSGEGFRHVAWNLLPMFCDLEEDWQTLHDNAVKI